MSTWYELFLQKAYSVPDILTVSYMTSRVKVIARCHGHISTILTASYIVVILVSNKYI